MLSFQSGEVYHQSLGMRALWPFVQLNIFVNDLGKGGRTEAKFADYARLCSELL